jgi:branched-chain amino acid transport system substrate-binding protein
MRRSSPATTAFGAVIGLLTAMAACSSGAATATPPTQPATTTTVPRVDDGVLTIGVLTPQGSANADIGAAITGGVGLAIKMINDAGGYAARPVALINANEGAPGAGSDPAIATLLDGGVDAIIGPASSTNALAGLGDIVDAGVVACSPTASSSLLDEFPDHNLFFRTIPSDSLQAVAIAEQVDRTGASRATITYIDDAYGQAFAESIGAALQLRNIEKSEAVPYSANNQSIDAAAAKVASLTPGVVVVVGDATSGPVMLAAIDSKVAPEQPVYVVNDAMRRPAASAESMGASLVSRVFGLSPIAYSTNQEFIAELGSAQSDPNPFAANAFDCVNLIALAAVAAHSTLPAAIAARIPAVSDGGSPCATFSTCKAETDAGNNINYDGPGGTLTLSVGGDVAAADFRLFKFDESGRDINIGFVPVR